MCMHPCAHTPPQTHISHFMFSLIVTLQSLALGYSHPPSFVIDLLFIDAIFINSIAKQLVSQTSGIWLLFALLVWRMFVCWRLRHNPTVFCCVKSPGVNSHTHQWSRCACVQSVAAPVFLSVTTTSRACPTAVPCCHIHLNPDATHAPHIHYTWVLHTSTYRQSGMSFQLPFQGT